jgi:hypothetical protein
MDLRKEGEGEAQQKPSEGSARPVVVVNAPLDFTLKALDAEHPYLKARGLTSDSIAHFRLAPWAMSSFIQANKIFLGCLPGSSNFDRTHRHNLELTEITPPILLCSSESDRGLLADSLGMRPILNYERQSLQFPASVPAVLE